MDQSYIALNAHERTAPCAAALAPRGDRLSLAHEQQMIFDLVGADAEDRFVLTSSGAEGVNQAFWSVFFETSRKTGKCHFVVFALEDTPQMQMLRRLEELGCYVAVVPADEEGAIDLSALDSLTGDKTALISLSLAQGLTGVIQPVEQVAAIAKKKKCFLHIDASYALGKCYISLRDLGADYVSFSGELLHAPCGIGGLFARREAPLVPLIVGGGGLRGGEINAELALGLCAACRESRLFLDVMNTEVVRLKNLFHEEIATLIPGAKILFPRAPRLPNVSLICFPRVHQEALHPLLLHKKVKASIGGDGMQRLDKILSASHGEEGECVVSFALSRMTTEEEVRRASRIIAGEVKMLQAVSHGVFHDVG